MSKWTDQLPEAARDYIGNRRVDEVECIIGDIAGVARGKAMPAAKFAKQTNYFLPNSIFLQTITGEWADNPFDAFTEPDMILEPDWSTATAAPQKNANSAMKMYTIGCLSQLRTSKRNRRAIMRRPCWPVDQHTAC